jgi:hypothetical protein
MLEDRNGERLLSVKQSEWNCRHHILLLLPEARMVSSKRDLGSRSYSDMDISRIQSYVDMNKEHVKGHNIWKRGGNLPVFL